MMLSSISLTCLMPWTLCVALPLILWMGWQRHSYSKRNLLLRYVHHLSPSSSKAPILCFLLWSIAMTHPVLHIDSPLRVAQSPPLWIILENSAAMLHRLEDGSPMYVRARFKVHQLLEHQPLRPATFILAAQKPYTVVPLTQDHRFLQHLLKDWSPDLAPNPGFNLSLALETVCQQHQRLGLPPSQVLILSHQPPAWERKPLEKAQSLGLSLHSIVLDRSLPLSDALPSAYLDIEGSRDLVRLKLLDAPVQQGRNKETSLSIFLLLLSLPWLLQHYRHKEHPS